MIKVLLVDDHKIVREGIKLILAEVTGIKVIGEAADGTEAISQTRDLNPDVVLLDLQLPDISGLEVLQKLLHINPELKVVVLTATTNDLFPFRLLDAGAMGYLTKEAGREELTQAIRTVHAGQRLISPAIANQLALSKIEGTGNSIFDSLSNREMEVMLMVIRGMQATAISKKLFLSSKTVHSYRGRIFEKLGVKNDVELTLLAIQHGIIDLQPIDSEVN